jgi:hypothetical protein
MKTYLNIRLLQNLQCQEKGKQAVVRTFKVGLLVFARGPIVYVVQRVDRALFLMHLSH